MRPINHKRPYCTSNISIHAPAKGATMVSSYLAMIIPIFQSTHPRRVRLVVTFNIEFSNIISIHAPAKGATLLSRPFTFLTSIFQSTHPRRVRLSNFFKFIVHGYISIHAPAKGATAFFSHYLLLKNTANHFLKSFVSFFLVFL